MTNQINSTNLLSIKDMTPAQLYEKMDKYYSNNELYSNLGIYKSLGGIYGKLEKLKPIRTVVHRSVEFFVSKIAPRDVVVSANSDIVKESIEQILKWSNFNGQKSKWIRHLSLYGDLFLKVVSDVDKVYFEEIDAKNITYVNCNARGYVTEIRIDVDMTDENDRAYIYTEYWNKADGYMAIWEHNFSKDLEISKLGDPKEYYPLAYFGISFLPFVHIKFQDIGENRGVSCVSHALSKIDEANREATRLNDMLFRFNKPLFISGTDATDKSGRPLPALKLGDSITLDDDSIISMPGTYKLDTLVPNINYDSALAILNSMMNEIENDMPELKYFSLKDGNLSGKAISLLLAGAIDKAEEARGNFISGLKTLSEMALTIAIFLGIFPPTVGKYENGDFESTFDFGEMFSTSLDEKATTLKIFTDSGVPLSSAMKMLSFTDEQITEAVDAKTADEQSKQNALVKSLMGDTFTPVK